MKKLLLIFFLFISGFCFSQKDSLQLGDYYADDQIYIAVSYNQFFDQPSVIRKSTFSYGLSTGIIKDFILNTRGSLAVAFGAGYGFDSFNHKLKVTENNGITNFSSDGSVTNEMYTHNIEIPFEVRWRSSAANKYNFWRIYLGLKTTYNFSNQFDFTDSSGNRTNFNNVSAFNKWQFGLTFSAGYDAFNIHIYYGLNPIYDNATISGEAINTKIIKFGLIYYLL